MLKKSFLKTLFFLLLLVFFYLNSVLGDWSAPRRIVGPGNYGDAEILEDHGDLHLVCIRSDEEVEYRKSTDCGSTWSPAFVLSDTAIEKWIFDPQFVKCGLDLAVFWINHNEVHGWISYSKSHDNGITWEGPFTAADTIASFSGISPDACGENMNVVYSSGFLGYETSLFSQRSTDCGVNWSVPFQFVDRQRLFGYKTACYQNIVILIWSAGTDSYFISEILLARSTDSGDSWSEPISIAELDSLYYARRPSIAINDSGIINVCWTAIGPFSAGSNLFFRQSPDNGISWTTKSQITFGDSAEECRVFAIADTVCVAWEDLRSGLPSVYATESRDGGLTWSAECHVDYIHSHSQRPSMKYLDGRIYLVWSSSYGVYLATNQYNPNTVFDDIGQPEPNDNILISPNPFNAGTKIYLPNQAFEKISIYDIKGCLIKELSVGNDSPQVAWDATDSRGNSISSGIYFAHAVGKNISPIVKMLYLK